MAAVLDTLSETRMVKRTAIQRIMISMKAISGFFRPKKIMDQQTFNTSWMVKKKRAVFTPGCPSGSRQIK